MINKEFSFINNKNTIKLLTFKDVNILMEVNYITMPKDISVLHITENNNVVEILYNKSKNNIYN